MQLDQMAHVQYQICSTRNSGWAEGKLEFRQFPRTRLCYYARDIPVEAYCCLVPLYGSLVDQYQLTTLRLPKEPKNWSDLE